MITYRRGEIAYEVDDTSIIESTAKIGNNTKIWHFCHVEHGTVIGDDCILGQNVFIGRDVKIGNGVKIQNNVSIYKGVEIEDNVFIGPSVVFTNVYNPRAFIEKKHEFRKTHIKKGATLGANSTIICGITIGEYALIGAGAVVRKDVLEHSLMVGVPAKRIGWVNYEGETVKDQPSWSRG